jgi:hypothetical protein
MNMYKCVYGCIFVRIKEGYKRSFFPHSTLFLAKKQKKTKKEIVPYLFI